MIDLDNNNPHQMIDFDDSYQTIVFEQHRCVGNVIINGKKTIRQMMNIKYDSVSDLFLELRSFEAIIIDCKEKS